uniref:Uncharacterized protein n=1 Tax=Meloidogyne hapla TaxID=6305 RepID=A0A1I8BW64_MELHA
MSKIEKTIFHFLLFLSPLFQFLIIFINCQKSSPGNEEFPQEKSLNKFLYQFEGIKEEIQNYSPPINPLFFPLNRINGLRTLPSLPPSQIHSNGLLLPNPAQLPSIFRLSATAMSQSQAFPLNSNTTNPLLEKQIKSLELTTKNNSSKNLLLKEEITSFSSTSLPFINQNIILLTSSFSSSSSSISSTESEITTTTTEPPPPTISSTDLSSFSLPSDSTQSQLSSTLDFETFLKSVNISEKYKEEFLNLMESEIKRRLENRLNENKKDEKIIENEKMINPIFEEIQRKQNKENIKEENENDFGINSDFSKRSELRTVNTRLFSLASGEGIGNEQQKEEEEKKRINHNQFSNSAENLNNNNNSLIQINNENDYRKREQEEFDKLLSKLAEETNKQEEQIENNKKEENEEEENIDDLYLLVPPPPPSKNKFSKSILATTTISSSTTIKNIEENNKQLIKPKIEENQIDDRDRAIMMLNRHNRVNKKIFKLNFLN